MLLSDGAVRRGGRGSPGVVFHRDIDKALQAEEVAAEEKSTETATPAETVPAAT